MRIEDKISKIADWISNESQAELLKLRDSRKRKKIEVPVYYHKDENGAFTYDFEAMVEFFNNRLDELR
jgi:phage pi2 protein 07